MLNKIKIMFNLKKLFFFLIFLINFCFIVSCDTFVQKTRRNIIVFIDYSASNREKSLDRYINIINDHILSNMGEFDCLTVVPIDEGSKIEPVKLIFKDFADSTFKKQSDGFAHANDSLKMRLQEFVGNFKPFVIRELKQQKIIRNKYTHYTDIFGAIHQLPNLIDFNQDRGNLKQVEDFVIGRIHLKSENIIVLLSDMIQDSKEYSFNSNKGVSEKMSQKILSDLENKSKIPDLKDCSIFVIGATGHNNQQIDNIEAFWKKYFELTNSNLIAYGYSVEDRLRKHLKS
jgi:hypothetical protein